MRLRDVRCSRHTWDRTLYLQQFLKADAWCWELPARSYSRTRFVVEPDMLASWFGDSSCEIAWTTSQRQLTLVYVAPAPVAHHLTSEPRQLAKGKWQPFANILSHAATVQYALWLPGQLVCHCTTNRLRAAEGRNLNLRDVGGSALGKYTNESGNGRRQRRQSVAALARSLDPGQSSDAPWVIKGVGAMSFKLFDATGKIWWETAT